MSRISITPQCIQAGLLSLALLLTPWTANQAFADGAGQHDPAALNLPSDYLLPLEELRTFAEVFERIKQAYVHPVSDAELLEYAIRGMLDGLDPHSSYMSPDAFQQLQESTQGEFGGLGIEITLNDGYIEIVSPIDDTPAAAAGLQAQDRILQIDGIAARNLPLDEAIDMMRGPAGTDIQLTIQRPGLTQPFDVTLTRAVIQIVSVRHELLEEDIGYLRIAQFQQRTAQEAERALDALQQANQERPLQGLILDLRNNPGGILQSAADISDLFLENGLIVYTEGRLPDTQMRFEASAGDRLAGVPLVVLINSGSASASEIVAGALQDHRRAVIMGSTSFGKGSVQTILPLNNNYGLKMTTALYYTPLGRSIQNQGIQPDIEVQAAQITLLQEGRSTREADLPRHLENQQLPASAQPRPSRATQGDYPLHEALNLLKGLAIFRASSALPASEASSLPSRSH